MTRTPFHPLATLLLASAFALLAVPAQARSTPATEAPATDAQAIADITALVNDFLEHVDQAATHDRFWAPDLVYTSSAGEVTDKAAIMKGFEAPPAAADAQAEAAKPDAAKPADAKPAEAKPDDPKPEAQPERYTAEDILVRPHGDAAALTFRLVRHAADGTLHYYRNSGMLLRRDGRWQVITWQATKVPEPEAK
jgi:hypothetical protein